MNVNVNVKDEELVVMAVVDDTLSRLRLVVESSMSRGQTVGLSLRDGRLDAMMKAR